MSIDQFLTTTRERLPNAAEIVSLCAELQIAFAVNGGGRPVLRPNARNQAMALLIAKLIAREPWRSQVISLTDLTENPKLEIVDDPPTPNPHCSCGSTKFVDTPIHDGQSLRRDCAACHRFLSFPKWYGKT